MAAILGNLWPLSSNTKDRKVVSGYQVIEPGTLGCHAQTLTTALLSPQLVPYFGKSLMLRRATGFAATEGLNFSPTVSMSS